MSNLILAALAVFVLSIAGPAQASSKVQEVVSPGGIKAWLIEEHSLPLVTFKFAFAEAGDISDKKEKSGLADMTTAMLFEGAGPYRSTEYQAELEKDAIRMSLDTDEDLFVITTTTLSEKTPRALEFTSLALTKPRLEQDSFDRVRTQMISRVGQLLADPSFIAGVEWRRTAFPTHPYGMTGVGTVQSIRAIELNDIREFVKRYLTRENLIIGVVGDIDAKTLAPLLDKTLGGLPTKFEPLSKGEDVKAAENKLVFRRNKTAQSIVVFSAPAIMRNDPHYYDAYVLNQILGGGEAMSSRLFTEIREKRGLAYSSSSSLDSMVHSSILRGGFSTRNNEVDQAIGVFKQTLKAVQEKGVTQEELKDAKSYLTGTFPLRLDNNNTLASFLISMQLYHLGIDFLEKRNALVEAVTLENVNKMAKDWLAPEHFVTVVVGNPPKTPEGAIEVKGENEQ